MLSTSELYKSIVASEHSFEWKAQIDGVEYLADQLISARSSIDIFDASNGVSVGNCVCGQLEISLLKPSVVIPRMAEIKMFVRATDGNRYSEWLPKGTYYISTRKEDTEYYETDILDIHAYDAMLKTEQPACSDGDQGYWPKSDIDTIKYVASKIGVGYDDRNTPIMDKGYSIPYPGHGEEGYTLRELAGYVASMYAANCIITEENKFRLVSINGMPEETYLLTDEYGNILVFGSDSIIIGEPE